MPIKWTTWNGQILRKAQPSETEPGEIENINRQITSTETETVIKSSNKQKPRTRWLNRRILSTFREELTPILSNSCKI